VRWRTFPTLPLWFDAGVHRAGRIGAEARPGGVAMPFLALLPLITAVAPLAARLIGNAVDGKAGAKVAEEVATQVGAVAARVLGTDDPLAAATALQADPAKAAEFAREMNQLATQVQLATLQGDLDNVRSARGALTAESWWVSSAPGLLSVIITVGFFGTLLALITGAVSFDARNQTLREVLALLLGALTLAFGDVRNFWLGSSAGSKKKDEELAAQAQRAIQAQSDQTRFVMRELAAPAVQRPLAAVPATPMPETPAARGFRKAFPGGVGWRTTKDGVLVEGEPEPVGTIGAPNTVRRIWRSFGPQILKTSAEVGVPAELIVATIATESRGDPNAERTEPDGRKSVGLMQTLLGTAAEAMGRPVTEAELRDPAISIEAGARYIRQQRPRTDFEPPLVAAAYNAGSIRENASNRWHLHCTPEHVDRFVKFYNDAVRVSKEDGWFT
jgi:soluble lytic murein transglycosylase-like protein